MCVSVWYSERCVFRSTFLPLFLDFAHRLLTENRFVDEGRSAVEQKIKEI